MAVLVGGLLVSTLACGVGRWTQAVVGTHPAHGLPSLPGLTHELGCLGQIALGLSCRNVHFTVNFHTYLPSL